MAKLKECQSKKMEEKKKEKVWELFKNRTQLKGIHTFLAKITWNFQTNATFSLRLSTWVWEPIIKTPAGASSSLPFIVWYESVLPATDFSISFRNSINGPCLLPSKTNWVTNFVSTMNEIKRLIEKMFKQEETIDPPRVIH